MTWYSQPELQAIIKIIRSEQLSASELEIVNQQRFPRFLKQQKIISVFRKNYQDLYAEIPPKVDDIFFKQQALNFFLRDQADSLFQILDQAQLKYIPYKGIFYMKYIYQQAIRDINDIDLLISPYDFQTVNEILADLGYRAKNLPQGQALKFSQRIDHAMEYIHSETKLSIDVHWKLAQRFFVNPNLTSFYFNTAKLEDNVYLPQAEMQILALAIHSYKNNWQELQAFFDLKQIIEKYEIDWDLLFKFSKQFRMQTILKTTLALGIELLRLDISLSEKKSLLKKYQKFQSTPNHFKELSKYVSYSESIFDKLSRLVIRYILPFGDDFNNQSKTRLDVIKATIKKFVRKFNWNVTSC